MEIRRFKVKPGCSDGETLQCIYDALQEGLVAAIPAENLAFMQNNSICSSEESGEFTGCYLFDESSLAGCGGSVVGRLFALALIFFLLPLYLLIIVLVFLVDGAPVLFSQQRFGLHNSEFKIFKFRTMVLKSEGLHQRMQRRWGEQGRLFKMENDPRVTSLGGFLRSTFLDEMPQLFNVVKGDMRLIGARPLPASDEHHYKEAWHRLRVRGVPGVTGLWQVSGRNDLTFDQMCLLDYYYCCNRSWIVDLMILLRTVKIIFGG